MLIRAIVVASFLLASSAFANPETAFVEWARSRAVPLDDSGKAFRSLDAGISEARLIGVGESVHEMETFLAFRLELLKDLVRRHRVTAVTIETGLPEAMALNDYVLGRKATVDYDVTLPGGFGRMRDIQNAMEWLREWNLGEGRKHPVSVYGVDLPNRTGSMVPSLDALSSLAPSDEAVRTAVEALRPTAQQIHSGWWKGQTDKYAGLSPEAKQAFTANVARLADVVSRLKDTDRERLDWIRRLSRVVVQNEEVLRLGAFAPSAPRDVAMAENTFWVLGRLKKGERAVYWAHNAHVQKVLVEGAALPPGKFPPSGLHFHEKLGKQYFAIATSYGGPSVDRDKGKPAEEGSVDSALEKVATHPYVLPLRGAPQPEQVAAWLAAERLMRFQVGYLKLQTAPAFDAIVYFDQVKPVTRVK